MNILAMFSFPLVILGLFFLALLAAWPIAWLVSRHPRMAAWPDRPMDNGELKARWATRYHQASHTAPRELCWLGTKAEGTDSTMPNRQPWPWLGKFSIAAFFSQKLWPMPQFPFPKPTDGHQHDVCVYWQNPDEDLSEKEEFK